jgi:hypothetical protein
MTNVIPERSGVAGRIFVITDEEVVSVFTDLNTMNPVELCPGSHLLSLGGAADRYEFCYMEEQMLIAIDALDALILEMYAEEIA